MEQIYSDKVGAMLEVRSGLVPISGGVWWLLQTQIVAVLRSKPEPVELDRIWHEPVENSQNVKAFHRIEAEDRIKICHDEVVKRLNDGAKTYFLYKLHGLLNGGVNAQEVGES